ncbi:bifunctional diguanylate cyclase/phosphodiesterase [Rhizobium sp. L1K21]|uniref:putative bifunctional diguanylate cyclase/phosphodiesterase n=1 Tax=Rhizobium sp. L1K21 TaxID=2954933 RepID=UPI00209287FA|nr:bifunctional diguanylate cyclase/phosphodiesterase [Rhizobium sp. L1K21]MCO6186306.1 bifunctional diguanylate cyclase/phosphodiesterase [Rhizobium sp. L1K21]
MSDSEMQITDELVRRAKSAAGNAWWEGQDPVLRQVLDERNEKQNLRLARFGLWAAAITYVSFGFSDIYLLPDVGSLVFLFRIGLAIVVLSLLETGIWLRLPLKAIQAFSAMAILASAFGWLFISITSSERQLAAEYTIFGTIFILATNLFFNFRFSLAAASSSIVTAGCIYATTSMIDVDFKTKFIHVLFFTTSLTFSLYLAWRLSHERYHTFVNSLQAQIQEQVAIEKGRQLKKIAETDPLTGMLNRRALSQEFFALKRSELALGKHIGVILIDVDFFKRYNDSLGHDIGDECLIRLSQCFQETACAYHGVAGRYGGEEFLLLCSVRDKEELATVAKALCDAVEALKISHPDRPDKRDIITISAGATMTETEGAMELSVLLQQADRALYASKFASRATFTIYDPEAVHMHASRQNLALLLSEAVERELVSLVYQPIKDAQTGKLLGHETLMRLRDFDGTPIHPPVFIPAAEQTGAIVELGNWAIEQALTDLCVEDNDTFVTVNVSAVQLKTPGFPLKVAEILSSLGVQPHRLALEVTEGIDIYMEVEAHRNIENLKRLGVQIWLDDFGTGFAGLAWLNRFRFDAVKIDRSFLVECQSEQGLSLLEDMVRMLKHQKFTVLVEGVETGEQRALLKQLGVDLMQGYHLGMPAPIEKVERRKARGRG